MRSLTSHKGKCAIGALALVVGLFTLTDLSGVPQPNETGPREPAQLVPASAVFYVEFSQPRPIAQEIAAMLQGTAIDDLPGFISDFREKQGDDNRYFRDMISVFGALLGPEGLSEISRMKAGCFAITGFDKKHEPEFLWILLSGDSNIPGFYTRGLLSAMDDWRTIERVEGVRLYRQLDWRARRGFKKAMFKDKGIEDDEPGPTERFSGPTLANLPGLLIIGSNQATVRDTVRRARGKPIEQSLSASREFKKTQDLRSRPGLFFYADSAALRAEVGKVIEAGKQPRSFTDFWKGFETAFNLKSVGSLAGSLTLERGGLDFKMQLHHDADQELPVLSLLPEKPADSELLKLAPSDGQISIALSWPDGEKRWDRAMALADKLMPGAPPSKLLEGLEAKFKRKFGMDVSAKISGLTWSLGSDAAAAGYPPTQQVVSIRATDAKSAEALEEALLDGVRLAAGDATLKPTPAAGVEGVQQLTELFYKRDEAVLLIGLDAKQVSAVAKAARKSGALADKKVGEALKTLDQPIVVGVASPTQMILSAMRAELAQMKKEAGDDVTVKGNIVGMEKLADKLKQALETAPPAVMSISRQPGVTTFQAKQLGLRSLSVQTVDSLVEWQLRDESARRNGRRFGAKEKAEFKKIEVKVEEKKEEKK